MLFCRQKNQFFRLPTSNEKAVRYVVEEVEKELASDKPQPEVTHNFVLCNQPEPSSSSLSSENSLEVIRKKFRMKKQEV